MQVGVFVGKMQYGFEEVFVVYVIDLAGLLDLEFVGSCGDGLFVCQFGFVVDVLWICWIGFEVWFGFVFVEDVVGGIMNQCCFQSIGFFGYDGRCLCIDCVCCCLFGFGVIYSGVGCGIDDYIGGLCVNQIV